MLMQRFKGRRGSSWHRTNFIWLFRGLFYVDLFIPILTYIFGQAFLGGRTAIASIYRLSNERYGLKEIDNYLLTRFTKEIIHELGHTFGLIHCHVPACVRVPAPMLKVLTKKTQIFASNAGQN